MMILARKLGYSPSSCGDTEAEGSRDFSGLDVVDVGMLKICVEASLLGGMELRRSWSLLMW